MSSSIRLLTEEESAQIAEVSVDTIRKYRDCGLLDPIVKENRTFFQELDIRTLFYAKFKERESAPSIAPAPAAEPAASETAPAAEPTAEAAPEPAPKERKETIEPELIFERTSFTETDFSADIPRAESSRAESSRAELVGHEDSLPAAGELVELNKSLREQIQVLREERDWLRERIEKLEARSEREQMLLLSESENVRKLIATSTRKSFWQRALPWLGGQ